MEGKGKVKFSVKPKVALALSQLRTEFLKCIDTRLNRQQPSEDQEKWFDLALRSISPPKDVKEELVPRIGIRLA